MGLLSFCLFFLVFTVSSTILVVTKVAVATLQESKIILIATILNILLLLLCYITLKSIDTFFFDKTSLKGVHDTGDYIMLFRNLKCTTKEGDYFYHAITDAIGQLESLEQRNAAINKVLFDNANVESIISSTVTQIQYFVLSNMKIIAARLIIFDNEEYKRSPDSFDIKPYLIINDKLKDNSKILKAYSDLLIAISNITVSNRETDLSEITALTNAINSVFNKQSESSFTETPQKN